MVLHVAYAQKMLIVMDATRTPAAWNAFGMDKEGADYRACAAYGPLYK